MIKSVQKWLPRIMKYELKNWKNKISISQVPVDIVESDPDRGWVYSGTCLHS